MGGARGSSLLTRRLSPNAVREPKKGPLHPARRLGKPIVDPANIGNRVGMAVLLSFVFVAAVVIYGLKDHPPRYTGDVSIVGSLVLIDLALFFTKLHSHPGLLSPFFVWVGFASPLWFPRRRATL